MTEQMRFLQRCFYITMVAGALLLATGCPNNSADNPNPLPNNDPPPPPGDSHGNATLSWVGPSYNDDGSLVADLAAYRIYKSSTAGQYTTGKPDHQLPATTSAGGDSHTYTFNDLPAGTYFFIITAVNNSGLESGFSTEVSKTIH